MNSLKSDSTICRLLRWEGSMRTSLHHHHQRRQRKNQLMLGKNRPRTTWKRKRPKALLPPKRHPEKPLIRQHQLQKQLTRHAILSGAVWRKIWLVQSDPVNHHHISVMTLKPYRIWHKTTIHICKTCTMSWNRGQQTFTTEKKSPIILRYLTKTVFHLTGSREIFSVVLQTHVRLTESQNSRKFSNKVINLPFGWTLSVFQPLSVRVILRIHCDSIVRMGITFSFLSTKSRRLTRSYSIQMLRKSVLRYWTRSIGVENVARPTTKSDRFVDRRISSF